jgi:putative sugar O-methyltransferase
LSQSRYSVHSTEISIHWQQYEVSKEHKFTYSDLENFRHFNREFSSNGQDNATKFDFQYLAECVNLCGEEFVLSNLLDSNPGNSKESYLFFGRYFEKSRLQHIIFYKTLLDLISEEVLSNNFKVVCEIGGGFGSLASIILKNHNVKYILIDLPRANLQQHYYLKSIFPEKKFFTISDMKTNSLTLDMLRSHDIFILPSFIDLSESLEVDLFINTRSFMEMNKVTIKKYFSMIQSSISESGFFLNVNRYEKIWSDSPIRFSEYPYDQQWYVKYSAKEFGEPHIHVLLTQRLSRPGNIQKELENIDSAGKVFYFTPNLLRVVAKKLLIWLKIRRKR